MKRPVLTIAGSDSSGGAGIQADIKTMLVNGVYAMSAVTALTAQNTTGVEAIMEVSPDFLEKQLDAVFTDIFPCAVKIGMVSSAELIEVIAERLSRYKAENIVVDPVMVSSTGTTFMDDEAIRVIKEKLFPLAALITPNIPEAQLLTGIRIKSMEDMEAAAQEIGEKYQCAVLLKGGHCKEGANDLLWETGKATWFCGTRVDNPNTHGTGCTLSSAIASNLAKGLTLEQSVKKAKEYLSAVIGAMLDLGKGSGPMDHGYFL